MHLAYINVLHWVGMIRQRPLWCEPPQDGQKHDAARGQRHPHARKIRPSQRPGRGGQQCRDGAKRRGQPAQDGCQRNRHSRRRRPGPRPQDLTRHWQKGAGGTGRAQHPAQHRPDRTQHWHLARRPAQQRCQRPDRPRQHARPAHAGRQNTQGRHRKHDRTGKAGQHRVWRHGPRQDGRAQRRHGHNVRPDTTPAECGGHGHQNGGKPNGRVQAHAG